MNLWQFYKDNPTLLEAKIGDELAAIAAIVLGTSGKNALNVFVDGGSISSTPSGTQNVSIVSSITLPVSGTFWQATQPVSAISLPLPAGASTEATLALIKAKTDNLDVALSTRTKPADTQTVSGSVSVSNFPASQAVTGPLTNAELRALAVPISGSVAIIGTVPVSGTFFQATQPVSTASLPLPTNAAQETSGNLATIAAKDFATQATLALIKTKTDNLDVLLSTRTKPSDTQLIDGSAHVQPVSGTFFQATQPVSIATMPTTPVTGTFFQATQPISAVSLPLPTGAATEATLADIELDLDQFTFSSTRLLVDGSGVTQPVSGTVTATFPTSTTPTLSSVAGSASSVTILAANANRRVATVFNDSTSTLYLKYGSSASTSSFTVLLTANAYYELPQPVYTGILTGIWLVATGNARVTEVV